MLLNQQEVPIEKRYKKFLPVYNLRAACGYFEDNCSIPDNEAEGWVDISDTDIKATNRMFAIYAAGDSMLPKIKNGDLCFFKFYSPDNGGSREGEIVLVQCLDYDTDYDCHYTIKRYHSEKETTEEGWHHSIIELQPLNSEYKVIKLDAENECKIIGILKGVL